MSDLLTKYFPLRTLTVVALALVAGVITDVATGDPFFPAVVAALVLVVLVVLNQRARSEAEQAEQE